MINNKTPNQTDTVSSMLFTVPELADYLGIGRNRAYDLLRNETIHGFKIGCTWKVSKAAVDKYIYKKSGLIESDNESIKRQPN